MSRIARLLVFGGIGLDIGTGPKPPFRGAAQGPFRGSIGADDHRAGREPVDRGMGAVACRARQRPGDARKLPAGPARDRAIQTVTQILIYHSPEQTAEWYRSLGAAERKTARAIFDRTALSEDKRRQLEEALKER